MALQKLSARKRGEQLTFEECPAQKDGNQRPEVDAHGASKVVGKEKEVIGDKHLFSSRLCKSPP